MRILRLLFSVISLCTVFLAPTIGSYAAAVSPTADPFGIPWPIFTSYDETRLQGVLASSEWIGESTAVLNKRLAEIDVRTRLEDTERLHYDRG